MIGMVRLARDLPTSWIIIIKIVDDLDANTMSSIRAQLSNKAKESQAYNAISVM